MDSGAGKLEHQLDEDGEDDQFEPPGGVNEAVTQLVPHAAGHKVQSEYDGQHEAPGRAPRQEDGQIGPLKVGQDAPDDLIGRMEGVGAEKDPQESHETEGHQP